MPLQQRNYYPDTICPIMSIITVAHHAGLHKRLNTRHHHHLFAIKQVQAVTRTPTRVTGQQGTYSSSSNFL